MKRKILLLCCILFAGLSGIAQESKSKKIPAVTIKTLEGKNYTTSQFSNDGKPMIISFWASWCRPCLKELSAIADLYDHWQDETGVKLIAISVDDSRTVNNVRPLVNSKAWDYEFYLDTNGDFKRAMGVSNVPHTFVLNGNGEIVFQHSNYSEGSESELFKEIKSLVGE